MKDMYKVMIAIWALAVVFRIDANSRDIKHLEEQVRLTDKILYQIIDQHLPKLSKKGADPQEEEECLQNEGTYTNMMGVMDGYTCVWGVKHLVEKTNG